MRGAERHSVARERWWRGRARALSDEGDDPGLTDRVSPPVSEREATAESDKRSRQRADWARHGGRRWAAVGLEKK
jgi:hypothetical protein